MSDASQVLTPAARDFLAADPPRYCSIATLDPDGAPRQAVLWYALRDDGTILLNSAPGRRWPSNLLRDPRCTILVGDGYAWVSVRGEVTAVHDLETAYEDIAMLARRYHAGDAETTARALAIFRAQDRISFHLRPRSVTVHFPG